VWDHSDHRPLVKVCTFKEIKTHTDLLEKSLKQMSEEINDKIEKSKEILFNISNKEKHMSSKKLIDDLQYVKNLLI
jgi:hypothetical protein